MGHRYIIVLADGRRLMGKVDEFPSKGDYILKDACFVENKLKQTPQGLGMQMSCSFPDGDLHVPTRLVWRPAKPREIELYEQVVGEAKRLESPLHLPAGTPTPDGLHLPPSTA